MSECVEYIESEVGFGWWTHGHVDKAAFVRDATENAMSELRLPPEEVGLVNASVTHGYVRESNRQEWAVSLSETRNGGKRATYVWVRM